MKVRDVLALLRADGWYLVKSGGSSHRQFKHPTKQGRVTVAGHEGADIPPGTLKSIRRQAQLEE
jgi:predicted RNA binding protein YcfA (HicA-like mRNA interferase family)